MTDVKDETHERFQRRLTEVFDAMPTEEKLLLVRALKFEIKQAQSSAAGGDA